MAALITANLTFFALAFLPPILWLAFYLREDRRHPEPRRLIILVFAGGIASAFIAIFVELVVFRVILDTAVSMERQALTFFLIIGIIEEYVKYLPVKFLVLRRLDFDEPIDAMIYMITAGLGFAALENILFVLPVFNANILSGIEITTSRFFGANLLHALTSGIVGFFLARSFFSPRRPHAIAFGVGAAALLHALFNYLIIIREVLPVGVFYLAFLLIIMFTAVVLDFRRLRRDGTTAKTTLPRA